MYFAFCGMDILAGVDDQCLLVVLRALLARLHTGDGAVRL